MNDLPERTISITTDVFARIWSLRNDGEETENDILKRILRSSAFAKAVPCGAVPNRIGYKDHRFGVSFDEGFEIFRSYRGSEIRAKAASGKWLLLSAGTSHGSLNALSRAVGANNENAWVNWFYLDPRRGRRPLSELRNPGRIVRRKRTRSKSSPPIGRWSDKPSKKSRSGADDTKEKVTMRFDEGGATWFDDVFEALKKINRNASLSEIYGSVECIRQNADRSTPPSLEAIVRRTLEESCSDTLSYKGGPDVFSMPDGLGAGIWALRKGPSAATRVVKTIQPSQRRQTY